MAALVTWRLLIGSNHEKRYERNAVASLTATPLRDLNKVALPRSRYAAVSLRICNNPCKAALQRQGQSVLVAEALSLPLKGCDRVCNCSYANHEDRRIAKDRRSPLADVIALDESSGLANDRAGRDRRRKRTPEPYQGIY